MSHNTYSERLDALFQLEFFGMKLGLENIRALLDFLGHPERKYPSIHIAGTNGKGSVAAMLAAAHQASGKRTGLYTSPHLVDFRERIRIDGQLISEKEVSTFLEIIWPKVAELHATFFEVTTALAFDHFARHKVDVAIIETGLGGRLDATNVLEKPLATVVTSIGFDHMAQLGSTLEAIASEKAGIFKRGVPAVVNCPDSVAHIFKQRAKDSGAPLTLLGGVNEQWQGNDWRSPFAGAHQVENLRTVVATLGVLSPPIRLADARRGIRNVAELTGLRARLEEIHSDQLSVLNVRLFLDVGHNEDALRGLLNFFATQGVRPIVVIGMMRDKEIDASLRILHGFAKRLITVQAQTHRASPSAELNTQALALGIDSADGGDVRGGVRLAFEGAISGDTILITGSHYVCGEFLQMGDIRKNFAG